MHITRKHWYSAITVFVLAGLLVALGRTEADLDLWGHVRWGMDFIRERQLLQVDPYSYLTAGQTWIDHQWLGDVLIGSAWLAGNSTGLVLLKISTWLLTLSLVYLWLLRNGLAPLRAGIILFLGMPILTTFTGTIRPVMFTALGTVLLLLILCQFEAGKPRWLWGLPLIFLGWVNLHGAFLIGIGLLGIWAVVTLMTRRDRKTWLQVLPPVGLSLAVTLVNPFGLDLWRFLFEHMGEKRFEITEWQPLALSTKLGLVYIFWVIASLLGIVYSRQRRSPALLTVLAVTAYLPLVSQRHLVFFSLAALVIAGPHIGSALELLLPSPPPERPAIRWAFLVPLGAAFLLLLWKPPHIKTIPFPEGFVYPTNAVALLQQSGVEGNLAVYYDWGYYATWHLNPKVKISVDTRREQVFNEKEYNANLRFLTGIGGWNDLLDNYPTDLVLLPPGSVSANLMGLHPGWEIVYQDEQSILFARQRSKLAKTLSKTAQGFLVEIPEIFP
jgi:hypothetical protein